MQLMQVVKCIAHSSRIIQEITSFDTRNWGALILQKSSYFTEKIVIRRSRSIQIEARPCLPAPHTLHSDSYFLQHSVSVLSRNLIIGGQATIISSQLEEIRPQRVRGQREDHILPAIVENASKKPQDPLSRHHE